MATDAEDRAGAGLDVERYRPGVLRHVRSLVRDRSEAEDLTQDVFLRAHEQLATLRDPGAVGVWLYRIATRVCLDHLRRGSTGAPVPDASRGDADGTAAERVSDEGPTLDQLVDGAAMSACGERLLDALPDAYRSVLLLHDLHDLTSVEIARLTRSTPGSVKIRLHRARRRFREALERECELYRDHRGVLMGSPRPRRR